MAWVPRSPRESLCDLVWLPRLLDKARREAEGRSRGVDLITPYMFGDNDYLDAKLMAFLKVRERHVVQIVSEEPDDEQAAVLLVALSGRSREACRSWSARFLRRESPVLWMIDVDEARRVGPAADVGRWLYNRVVIPPVFRLFRWMESKKPTQ
jgi:hypothetical protein